VSAQPIAPRRGFVAALVAQVSSFLLEPPDETVERAPAQLRPHPVIGLAPAAARAGTTTVARMLAAELAARAAGAAIVWSGAPPRRRNAPPHRAAARLATALRASASGVPAQACGRICIVSGADQARTVDVARYLAPVVLDLPADGTAAAAARAADRVAIVASATHEPALADAVAFVIGGAPVKVVTRAVDAGRWSGRADIFIPDARMAARAALLGTRPLGALGRAIGALADALDPEVAR
jgi:hypothetical protein